MHLEEGHHPPRSLGEFLRQYAMIVLSILTALALERGAVALQDRAEARASRERILAELARNREELAEAETRNAASGRAVRAALEGLLARMKAGEVSDADAAVVMTTLQRDGNLALVFPTLQRDAWEAAIADHSADHLAAEDLRRFTEVYAQQRDAQGVSMMVMGGDWMTPVAELSVGEALGRIPARDVATQLMRFVQMEVQVKVAQEELMRRLRAAAGGER
jgi:hypothetical protein